MFLYVVSSNLNTIYFPDELDERSSSSKQITKLCLNNNPCYEDVTTIVWEATDEDLFDYRINISISDCDSGDDRLYICSKLTSMIDLIDSCCLLESISIITIEKHYNELVNIFKDFSVPVSLQVIESLSIPDTIKEKPICVSLRNKLKPANILEYVTKHSKNLPMIANYISIPLFTNYRRIEMQRLAEQSPLPILAVTAVVKHNVFTETVLFREEFTRAIDICRILKAKYVIYGSSNTKTVPLPSDPLLHYNSYNHGLKRFVTVMRDMAIYAKEFGITIIVKPNRKTKFLEDQNDLAQVIHMIRSDNVMLGPRTQSNGLYANEYNDFILLESEHPSFLDVLIPKLHD